MKQIINELKDQLGKFFEIVPGYFTAKAEIFNLINRLEEKI